MLCGPSPSPLPSSEGSRHTRRVTRTGKLDEEKGGDGKVRDAASDKDQRQLELGSQRER